MVDPTIFAHGVPIKIEPTSELRVDLSNVVNAHIFTVWPRGGGTPRQLTLFQRTAYRLRGSIFEQVQLNDVTADLIPYDEGLITDDPSNQTQVFGSNDGGTTFFAVAVDGQGRLHVVVEDASTVAYPQPYLGGVGAPASGRWIFVARVTTGGTALTVNNGGGAVKTLPIGRTESTLEAGENSTYEYPVTKGTTYTVSGGTVTDGQITPS
jgi:hypothetical protein